MTIDIDEFIGNRLQKSLKDALKFQESLYGTAAQIRSFIKELDEIATMLESGTARTHLAQGLYAEFMSIHDALKRLHASKYVGTTEEITNKRIEEGLTGEKVLQDAKSMERRLRRYAAEEIAKSKNEDQ